MYSHIYIYICIERERDIHIYIYIYTYIHIWSLRRVRPAGLRHAEAHEEGVQEAADLLYNIYNKYYII